MRKIFNHINEARNFIVEKLSNDTLLGRNGYIMHESKYIIDYKPAQAWDAEELARAIKDQDLTRNNIKVVEVNLYDIVLKDLDSKGIWDLIKKQERDIGAKEIIQMLQDSISVENVIKPAIRQKLEEEEHFDLVFITGVGETFPYIRTHTVLEELETKVPVVLWFPGTYKKNSDGSSSLDILDISQGHGGGYYRATNLFDL